MISYYLVFGTIVILPLLFLLTIFLGPKSKANEVKNSEYESGITNPIGEAGRADIRFYLVVILFLIFDVEVAFLLPWGVKAKELGMVGLIEMFAFLFLLVVALVYIYKAKALKWS